MSADDETAGRLLWEPSDRADRARRRSPTSPGRRGSRATTTSSGDWSVADIERFWAAIWDLLRRRGRARRDGARPRARCRAPSGSPGPRSPTPSTSSATRTPTLIAIRHASELRELGELTWGELREQTARIRAGLQRLGVGRGDRVAAYLPNIPETIAAFLACASLGAIWSSAAPEFGARSVDRPLRPDRAEGAARGRRLPLRRQGLRPQRDRRRDRRRDPRRSSTSSGSATSTARGWEDGFLGRRPAPELEFERLPF